MEALIAAQNEAEQKAADEERPVILPVVFDWETLDDVEEEPADAPPPLVTKIDTVTYSTKGKKFTAAYLRELYCKLDLQPPVAKNTSKKVLFNAIRDSQHAAIKTIDEVTFTYEYQEVPDHLKKGPRWKMLTGMDIALPEGFDPSGAEEGFFAPTNKENAAGEKKLSYLADEPINRPEFAAKIRKAKTPGPGRPKAADVDPPPSESGGPSHMQEGYYLKTLPSTDQNITLTCRYLPTSSARTW